MKLTTVAEMRNIDRRAIQEIGIPEVVLMENAAREVFLALDSLLGGVDGKRICVVAGTGNNGGDAFAAARHIANAGGRPKVFVLGKTEKMSASAAVNFNVVCNMGIEVFSLQEERDWDKLQVVLKTADGVVDGILGTGFHGTLRPEARRLIEAVNRAELPVLSIDVPSGVEADNGQVEDVAVAAAMTVTLGAPKWGMMFAPGSVYCGKLLSDGIGIPRSILEDERIRQEFLLEASVRQCLLPRPVDCHKGNCGRILVIAGSRGMTGAAVLAARAALGIGAGIVTLACPESLNDIYEAKLTEVMTLPVQDNGSGHFALDNAEELLSAASGYDLVLLGPGLGRTEEAQAFVRAFVAGTAVPVVLDADGIYAFRERGELLAKCRHVPVLTPHLGEMACLLGITVPELKEDLLDLGREAAKEYNTVFVIKSETTVVIYPDGMAYVSHGGNAGMATAGCGDVLAGLIAGLYKQVMEGRQPLAGVYIHSRAGELAYEKKGNCLIAGDIAAMIPETMKELAVAGAEPCQ